MLGNIAIVLLFHFIEFYRAFVVIFYRIRFSLNDFSVILSGHGPIIQCAHLYLTMSLFNKKLAEYFKGNFRLIIYSSCDSDISTEGIMNLGR